MEILDNISNWVIISYFLSGTLFLIYAFLIFLQKKIITGLRLGVSIFFAMIGLFFTNEGGKLITEGLYNQLNFIALVMTLIVSVCGMVVVYILLSNSKE